MERKKIDTLYRHSYYLRSRVANPLLSNPSNTTMKNSEALSSKFRESPVSALTNVSHKVILAATYLLHIKCYVKAIYYMFIVVFLSIFGDELGFFHIETLTGKYSVLNQVFVKMGWGWTLLVYFLLHLSCLPLRQKRTTYIATVVSRAISLTVFFYLWCQVIFHYVEWKSGVCVKSGIVVDLKKCECKKAEDHHFYSFDISGHAFLMSYCVLVLMMESLQLKTVLEVGQTLTKNSSQPPTTPYLYNDDSFLLPSSRITSYNSPNQHDPSYPTFTSTQSGLRSIQQHYIFMCPVIAVSSVCVLLLCLLWDLMLIITTIYYHTVVEKVLGAAIAILMWALQYYLLFPTFNTLIKKDI